MRCVSISLIAIVLLIVPYAAFAQNVEYIGSYATPGIATAVMVSGNYAYVAACDSGLQIINIGDPSNPIYTAGFYSAMPITDVFVFGDYAYVANSDSGLLILNIPNPANPTLVGSFATPVSSDKVFVEGNYAYITEGCYGVQFINIADPTIPHLAGEIQALGRIDQCFIDAFIVGSYAYTLWNWYNVDEGGHVLEIFEISDLGNPLHVGAFSFPGQGWSFNDVFVSGSYAYVADNNPGLHIIHISDSANPTLAGSYDTPGYAFSVFVAGSYAFMADGYLGLQIIDITYPAVPILAGSYDTPGSAEDVFILGDYIYIADSSSLQILRFNPTGNQEDGKTPNAFSLSQNYPNPFNAQTRIQYSLPEQSFISIDVFDLLGRKIETLAEGFIPAGEHSVTWDADGQPSGIYLYRIKAGDKSEARKMVLMK